MVALTELQIGRSNFSDFSAYSLVHSVFYNFALSQCGGLLAQLILSLQVI